MTAVQSLIATAIIDAPAWTLVGLTMPDPDMRERGAEELARWITERLDPRSGSDVRQLGLGF